MKTRIGKSLLVWLAIICAIGLTEIANSQETKTATNVPKTNSRRVQYFYIHALGTLGFDVYNSSDINALFTNDMKIHSIGFPFQYGIRAGFRHILQFEYHVSSSSAHNIGTVTGYVNGQWVGVSVPMKLKASDMLFKVNPFFWSWSGSKSSKPATCMFVVIGNGTAKYKDKTNEGFEGSGMIYGLEFGAISKYATFNIGMTTQQITYDKARLFGQNFTTDMKASRFILYTSLGFGFGI
jgi:hypothetical protein